YDLISSGFVNAEDSETLYWTVSNASGMDDLDLLQMLDKLRKIQATTVEGDGQLEPHTLDVPYLGKEAILERLEKQIYRDAMALNTYDIANGAVTDTQIEASYEPLNQKLDLFEMQILDFLEGILRIIGLEDTPTFTRSKLVNRTEEIQALVSAGMYLDQEYITEKIMTLLGDKDAVEDALKKIASDDLERLSRGQEQEENEITLENE
ncbi:MAG: phage portal protein, partial [Spirochaetales bacterium]|nr:phage portal protein [Spirochaetales bacterium]